MKAILDINAFCLIMFKKHNSIQSSECSLLCSRIALLLSKQYRIKQIQSSSFEEKKNGDYAFERMKKVHVEADW